MAKRHTRYVCQSCGATQMKWMGRCPDCGEWNTLVETIVEASTGSTRSASSRSSLGNAPMPLSDVPTANDSRVSVPIEELNRVLGGGIVPGAVMLIGGDPGIGKSTLLLQVAALIAEKHGKVLYVSGEESLQQIKLRAERLGLGTSGLHVLAETRLDEILAHIEQMRPSLVIVDSIQSVYLDALNSSAGSVSQVREGAAAIMRLAKRVGVPVFIVGHVTKTGNIAGPRVLEHIVDVVLYLEGERFHAYRLLRSVKNRFGSTNEVGVFEMRDVGMVEVPNPSQVFLEERLGQATGSAVAVTMEGTRPILVEVQALVSRSSMERVHRTCNGIDFNRLLLLTAVLSKRVGLRLGDQDVFVNVVGGLRVNEPAVDLAIALAITSSFQSRPVRGDLAAFGEVGLAGELRSVGQSERRLGEASKLGFTTGLMPKGGNSQRREDGRLRVLTARSLSEAVSLGLEKSQKETME